MVLMQADPLRGLFFPATVPISAVSVRISQL
jgi:hypothetical protein